MAAVGFPPSSVHQITYHQHKGLQLWRIRLTKLPGFLQQASMLTHRYTWAHATSPSGLLGFLELGTVLPSCIDIIAYDRAPAGFFASATAEGTDEALYKLVTQRSQAGKNSSSFVPAFPVRYLAILHKWLPQKTFLVKGKLD